MLIFTCYYRGGAVLTNQRDCPDSLDGEPLEDYDARLVEDVVSRPFPWWLVAIVILMAASEK